MRNNPTPGNGNELKAPPSEQILVVPTERLWETIPHHRGFQAGRIDLWERMADAWRFMNRTQAENDPGYKQLIPYIVLRHENQVFRYWRTKHGGESRLHHLYSIGVGGHINERDCNLFSQDRNMLYEAAARELQEEVSLGGTQPLHYAGTLNDDDTEVGQVHIGLVFLAEILGVRPQPREAALGRGEWIKADTLTDGVEYETWSLWLILAGLPEYSLTAIPDLS